MAALLTPYGTTHCLHVLYVVQGMLLDLDAATLTVWVNGERKGVMVRPGTEPVTVTTPFDAYTLRVGRLEGPLHWAADVGYGASVAIAGPLQVPSEAATSSSDDSSDHTNSD